MKQPEKINPVEIIVDLMEIKALSIRPFSASEYQSGLHGRMHIEYQYLIISQSIAMLVDKYHIKAYEIEDEIKNRPYKKSKEKSTDEDFHLNPMPY